MAAASAISGRPDYDVQSRRLQSTHRDDRGWRGVVPIMLRLLAGIDGLAQKQSDARREQAAGSEWIHRDHARSEILQQIDLQQPILSER